MLTPDKIEFSNIATTCKNTSRYCSVVIVLIFGVLLAALSLGVEADGETPIGESSGGETTIGQTDVDEPAAGECGATDGTVCGGDPGQIPRGNLPTLLAGNPVNLLSGNKHQGEIDFALPGAKLTLKRTYNSQNADHNIGFGQGWHNTFAVSLFDAGDGQLEVVQSSGSSLSFFPDGSDDEGNVIKRSTLPNGAIW